MLRRRRYLLVLILSLAIVVTACGEDEVEETTTEEGVAVEAVEASRGTIINYIDTTGEIEPIESAYLMPQAQGEIKEVKAELGQEVATGDELLRIDQELTALELDQTKARLEAAEADLDRVLAGARKEEIEQLEIALTQAKNGYKQTRRDFLRQQELYEQDNISQQRFEMSQLEYDAAEAEKESARLSLKAAQDGARDEEIKAVRANTKQARLAIEAAQIQLENSVVTAPFSGVIAEVNAQKGELAGNEPLFRLVNLDQIKIKTYYSEAYINDIELNDEVLIKVNALDKEFTANITNISPVSDQRNKAYLAEIVLDNAEHQLRSGMYARVSTVKERADDEIVIPQSAVFLEDGQEYVMVVEDNLAVQKEVETGITDGERVVILAGIKPEAEVIITGQERLTPEQEVRVINRGDE